jgi:NADH-quinone oxidoreductase subunit G
MGGLMLGYAQKGGIADLVAAKPKLLISLGADEVDYSRSSPTPSSSTSAITATRARMRRTSSCRPRLHREGRHLRQHRRPRAVRRKAVFAPGDAREDWTILRALADALGVSVGFDSFDQLARRDGRRSAGAGRRRAGRLRRAARGGGAASGVIGYPIKDFYLTNAIAAPARRCSAARPNCSTAKLRGGCGMTAFFQSIGMSYEWAWGHRHGLRHPADRAAADAGRGHDHLCRPQDLGGDGAAPRAPTWSARSACCKASPMA